MSEITINELHAIVMREIENEAVQELDPGTYSAIASFVGGLKRQEFERVGNEMRDTLVQMASELVGTLVRLRLQKGEDFANLLDIEKYVLDAVQEEHERTEMVLSAVLNGKSKLLDSVSATHRARPVTVRFLGDADRFVGADLRKYGPYRSEDIAVVPYDNAQALIHKEMASKVRLE